SPASCRLREPKRGRISSEARFAPGTIVLGRDEEGKLAPPTEQLAAGLEGWLRTRSGGLSLDVLREIRDSAWFDRPLLVSRTRGGETLLARYLVRLAHR